MRQTLTRFVAAQQILATLMSIYSIPWPPAFLSFLSSIEFAHLNFVVGLPSFSVECVCVIRAASVPVARGSGGRRPSMRCRLAIVSKHRYDITFITTWRCYVVGPLIVLAGLGALFMALHSWLAHMGARARVLAEYKDRCFQFVFWIIYIAYPGTTRACFMMLNCREFDPDEFYLVSDFRVKCDWDDEDYMKYYWCVAARRDIRVSTTSRHPHLRAQVGVLLRCVVPVRRACCVVVLATHPPQSAG